MAEAGPAVTGTIGPALSCDCSLVPRPEPGSVSRYRFINLQNELDEAFGIVRQTRTSGEFERFVEGMRGDGAVMERITWTDFDLCTRDGRLGSWSGPVRVPEASGFSYPFCAEDSYEDFHWRYESIPATGMGDAFMMHSVNTHFEFDFLRSRSHGAIEQLRRIGDSVVVPDSDRQFHISLRAAPITWTCTKRNFVSRLVGFGVAAGRAAAIVTFAAWIDVLACGKATVPPVERTGNTRFEGHLLVDPSNGGLLRGEFNEWVCLPVVTAESKKFARLFIEYRIARIDLPGCANEPTYR